MIPIGKIKKNEIKVKDKLDNMKLNKRNHGGNYSYVEIKIKKTKKWVMVMLMVTYSILNRINADVADTFYTKSNNDDVL